MKRCLAPLAVGMVLLYAALAMGAAGCFLGHAQPSHHSHDHGSQPGPAHSLLCAWGCQVHPVASALTAAPPSVVFASVALLWLVGAVPIVNLLPAVSRSRAPPC